VPSQDPEFLACLSSAPISGRFPQGSKLFDPLARRRVEPSRRQGLSCANDCAQPICTSPKSPCRSCRCDWPGSCCAAPSRKNLGLPDPRLLPSTARVGKHRWRGARERQQVFARVATHRHGARQRSINRDPRCGAAEAHIGTGSSPPPSRCAAPRTGAAGLFRASTVRGTIDRTRRTSRASLPRLASRLAAARGRNDAPGTPFIGGAFGAALQPGEFLALLAFNGEALAARLQAGLLIDGWTETVPTDRETTGVAFNVNRPNATAPLKGSPKDRGGSTLTRSLDSISLPTSCSTRPRVVLRDLRPTRLSGNGPEEFERVIQ
jgi:hypothetical protein